MSSASAGSTSVPPFTHQNHLGALRKSRSLPPPLPSPALSAQQVPFVFNSSPQLLQVAFQALCPPTSNQLPSPPTLPAFQESLFGRRQRPVPRQLTLNNTLQHAPVGQVAPPLPSRLTPPKGGKRRDEGGRNTLFHAETLRILSASSPPTSLLPSSPVHSHGTGPSHAATP